MKRFLPLSLLLYASVVSGCASDRPRPAYEPKSPAMASEPIEPQEGDLDLAISGYLGAHHAPLFSRYEYTRLDLNGDGLRDALVYMKTPFGHWCGDHGCTVLVFAAKDGGFTSAGAISPVRAPFYVSKLTSQGWRDLVVRVAGREERAKDVVLQFDGQSYPLDPGPLPPYLNFSALEKTKVFP
ncbi:MAG: hypothetical protein KDI13_04785 [Alphaproteobacteria bacterium]|nr:hypothetical protein [Alphaproteobacteria bacterium]